MEISTEIVTVRTKQPFVIARGGSSEWRVVYVRVRDGDGAEGWGEAAPSRFYGETPESVVAAVERFRSALEGIDPWALEEAEARMNAALRFNGAAKSAVSSALHDLAARRLGVPLWKLWGLDPARAPQSSFTIGIAADDGELVRRVEEAAEYPILK